MKYWILTFSFLLAAAMTMCACSHNEEEPEQSENPVTEPTVAKDKVLIAYFSCTDTTKGVADDIADITGGTLFRIEPETPYTSADLDYNSDCRANREQNNPAARPEIKGNIENLNEYDIVFLGYPIWWGEAPKIIYTFLEANDFAGKTIIPFCTSHSSGIGSSDTNLHSLVSDTDWKAGKRFGSTHSKSEIENWIENMDISISDNNVAQFNLAAGVNGNAPTVRLSSGYDMPIVGLGTYSLLGETCVSSVKSAIAAGFRKIDTAHAYGNEVEVGRGVRESGVPREEIFVATKIYPDQYSNPEKAIEECIDKLDIGYVDLMLLHHPGSNYVKAYKAMEKYVREGKIRSIGVSCYYIDEIDKFLPQVDIKPVLVQNEIHPYYQDTKVIDHLHSLGLVVEAWYPLGGRGHQKELLSDPVLSEVAERHGKSVAQIILRWDLQRGVVIIPGSSNPDHMRENISIFDFELSDEEMNRIAALNRNEKHDWY